MPTSPLPELLPGEDRSFGSHLFVDLIPRGCWFTNVRSCVSRSDWDRIRRMVYARADFCCEACGARPSRRPGDYIEAHERWRYLASVPRTAGEPTHYVQKLVRLIALCTRCHGVTHFGRAEMAGRAEQALAHLMRVTGMDRMEADAHVAVASEVWVELSRHDWELDLSMLTDVGVILKRDAPAAEDRAAAADAGLKTQSKWGQS